MTIILISLFLGLFWAAVALAAGLDYGWCVVMFVAGSCAGLFAVALCRAAGRYPDDDDKRD